MTVSTDPTTTFVIAVLLATLSQMVAQRFRFPPILLWLLTGMVLGPYGLQLLHVEVIEPALHTLIELGLAIILFEGGLNLHLKELKQNGWVVGRLIIFGPLFTILIGGGAAHLVGGLNWTIALLFGAIISVGGPTVILPIVRQMRLGRNVSHVLTAEAMLIDAIGAILAIVFLQLALTPEMSALQMSQHILYKTAVGVAIGLLGGRLLALLLAANISREMELRTPLTLAFNWGIFLLADTISSQAGLLAALIMGVTLQRMKIHDIERLKHFKGSLSMLLISVLFVLLAATINLHLLLNHLYEGMVIFFALALCARPAATLFSTIGSHLAKNDRLYLAGMAPRGVVAAGITSLFALILKEHGHPQADLLMTFTYIIIIVSILCYSLFARPLKSMLALEGVDARSVLIIGGGQIGAEMGRALSEDREVRFLDLNAEVIGALKRSGYDAVCGNALDPLYWEIIHAEEIGSVIVMTGSSDHNMLIARIAHEHFNITDIYVALQENDQHKHAKLIHQFQAKRLFAKPYNYTYWHDQAYRKRLIYESAVIEPESPLVGVRMADARIQHGMQPIAILRDGCSSIPHDDFIFAAGDEIKMLMRPERIQEQQPMILPPAAGAH